MHYLEEICYAVWGIWDRFSVWGILKNLNVFPQKHLKFTPQLKKNLLDATNLPSLIKASDLLSQYRKGHCADKFFKGQIKDRDILV